MADWKTRAAEYHRESARMLKWDVRRGGRYPSVDSLLIPGPVSDYQAAHGIAPDGRIGPATLRSMVEVSKIPGPKFSTEVVVEELDLTRADPDAGVPVRPGAERAPPPAPPPPGVVPPTPAPAPAPKKAWNISRWLTAAAVVATGIAAWRKYRSTRR